VEIEAAGDTAGAGSGKLQVASAMAYSETAANAGGSDAATEFPIRNTSVICVTSFYDRLQLQHLN